MSLKSRYFVPWLVAVGAAVSIAVAPTAAAEPIWPVPGAESASDTIKDLQADGFYVGINWVNSNPTVSLSQCWVNAIHNPDGLTPSPQTVTTVYIDIECPSDDSD
jgi:hypothetical protein